MELSSFQVLDEPSSKPSPLAGVSQSELASTLQETQPHLPVLAGVSLSYPCIRILVTEQSSLSRLALEAVKGLFDRPVRVSLDEETIQSILEAKSLDDGRVSDCCVVVDVQTKHRSGAKVLGQLPVSSVPHLMSLLRGVETSFSFSGKGWVSGDHALALV